MTEKQYRELSSDKYFHYSLLSKVDRDGGAVLFNEKKEESKSLSFGSLIHTLCLSPELFSKRYKVSKKHMDMTKTYEVLYSGIKEAILNDELTVSDISKQNDTYVKVSTNVVKQNELWSNIKNKDTLLNYTCNEEFIEFLSDTLVDADDDRIPISSEQYLLAQYIKKILQEHDDTKKYFSPSNDTSKYQILFEKALLFKYEGNDYKILLDIIFVDHENKTVRFIDLKTGHDTYTRFEISFYKWRYDIQSGIGFKALEKYVKKDLGGGYRILNPIFVYVNEKDNNYSVPYLFKVDRDTLHGAWLGFRTSRGKRTKGILELVDDIKYYRETKQGYRTKDIDQNNGIIEMDSDVFSYNRPYRELFEDTSERLRDDRRGSIRAAAERIEAAMRTTSRRRGGVGGTIISENPFTVREERIDPLSSSSFTSTEEL